MKQVSPQEFMEALTAHKGDGRVAFIDVRQPDEYDQGHIAGVRNIPIETLTKYTNELSAMDTIFIHCLHGIRGTRAMELLSAEGVTGVLANLKGGLTAWQRTGYPVVKV